MTSTNFSQTASLIWSVADLLRGDFKQSQYGRIILPFALLRRLECVLKESKEAVVAEVSKVEALNNSLVKAGKPVLDEISVEKMLLRVTKSASNPKGLSFFNTSPMNLGKMGQSDIKANIEQYLQCFSTDAREIFEHFKFDEFIGSLNDANLLFKVLKKFATTDLSTKTISNHDMGLVFEELIRRFAEGSNETAGEHFTPRDIVELTTSLVFRDDDNALSKDGTIRTIYDPTAGTGGFLSSGMEYVYKHNKMARMVSFGQELNPESYAICKADMLIKGQAVQNIKLGNTLSNDQLPADKFDYMLSNPPFGVDWKKIEGDIKDEHSLKGYDGRFGAGLPRVSDGSLLFLMHLISKMSDTSPSTSASVNGSRIGIILNGSPLFTGSAGSGESEIRRYILESDLLEGLIALPTDMFYNTGIATYVWILSNKKASERKGKVQLIDGSNLYGKMRKSLGSKRNVMSENDIKKITRAFGDFKVIQATELDKPVEQKSSRGRQSANPKAETPKTFASKIFDYTDFGYRRITIERPERLSIQITADKVESLRFAPKPFNTVMNKLFSLFPTLLTKANRFDLSSVETEIRELIKTEFKELKEKQIKDLLSEKLWSFQDSLVDKATLLMSELGTEQTDDFNQFEFDLKGALTSIKLKLETKEKKQFIDAMTWKNQDAMPVIKKVIKKVDKTAENPLYGAFIYQGKLPAYKGKVVEYKQDGDLRDNENVALNPLISTTELIESYFKKEVAPHVSDAWINVDKRDAQDDEIGIVGYEIPFNRHFYQYQPPRDLTEIDADLDAVSAASL